MTLQLGMTGLGGAAAANVQHRTVLARVPAGGIYQYSARAVVHVSVGVWVGYDTQQHEGATPSAPPVSGAVGRRW